MFGSAVLIGPLIHHIGPSTTRGCVTIYKPFTYFWANGC
jgi:hypothetical protein